MSDPKTAVDVWPVVVFIATALVLIGLFIKLFMLSDAPVALVIAIAAVAGLLILSPRVFDLVELTISKDGLIAKLRELEKKVDETKREVEKTEQKVQRVFAQTMEPETFATLRKLSRGNFGNVSAASDNLRRDLKRLEKMGFINVRGDLDKLLAAGANLSEHVTVTPGGKDIIDLRESFEGSGE